MAGASRVYLLVGDPALREEARNQILASLLGGKNSASLAAPKTNSAKTNTSIAESPELIRFYGDEVKLTDFLTQARTYPFFGGRQFILLSEPEELPKADLELLADFLPSLPDFTYLIMEAESVDKRTTFYRTCVKIGTVKEFTTDQAAPLERNVSRFLSERGKHIRREAFQELGERLGGNLTLIYQTLDQIITFMKDRTEITAEDVVTFVEREVPYGPFELSDALSERLTEKVLSIYRFLLDKMGQEPVELIGLIGWQIRRLWEVKTELNAGSSERDLARVLGLPPFAAGRLSASAKRFTRDEIKQASDGLFYLDWKMKTGRARGPEALQDFLLGWCTGQFKKGGIRT